jgi:hypothetical protein
MWPADFFPTLYFADDYFGDGAIPMSLILTTQDVDGNTLFTSADFLAMVQSDVVALIGALRVSQTILVTIALTANPDVTAIINPCGGE